MFMIVVGIGTYRSENVKCSEFNRIQATNRLRSVKYNMQQTNKQI